MAATVDWYQGNPLTHRDRRLSGSSSAWVRSFACEDLRPLIVCRGPIRKEAMDVFEEMGMTHYGILLSEKDSIVYPNALAPELRQLADNRRVHRVPDYTGATKEERVERMNQIAQIALDNGYDSIFAGYGFMAEDSEFVATVEKAGLKFIGPNSQVQERAGKKDEAKRTALEAKVSVTPGVNDVAARTLLRKHPGRKQLLALAEAEGLSLDPRAVADQKLPLAELADQVLLASYAKRIDLYSIEELEAQVQREVADMFERYPGSRVRLKAIGGGAGHGARGAVRGEGHRRGRQQERPHRAQHRADPAQRDPAPGQRQLVRLPGRPRLLAADARAKAAGGLGDPGGPGGGGGEGRAGRPPGRGRGAPHRSRDPPAHGGRRRPLRRRGRARLGLDLRVHRGPGPLLLHGGQHPHPGGAPGHRALLRAPLPEPRRLQSVLRGGVAGGGHGPAGAPREAAPQALEGAALRGRGGGPPQRHRRLALPPRRRPHPPLVEAHRGGDPRRPGHQPPQPRHRHVHALPGGRGLRLEHRPAAHQGGGPAGVLPAPGPGAGQHQPARGGPGHQPPIPLRARQLVHRAERDGQAHHPLRGAVSHPGGPPQGGGEPDRRRLRLRRDEEALRVADGEGGARRPVGGPGHGRGHRPQADASHQIGR